MNNIATAAAACMLATGTAIGAWQAGLLQTRQYADVIHARPVTVHEPMYVDVVDVAPVTSGDASRPRVLGYAVAYRVGDRVLSTRVAEEPGDQIRIGDRRRVIGYDVTWRYGDRTGTVRMGSHPGRRLPVVDGAIVEAHRPTLRSG